MTASFDASFVWQSHLVMSASCALAPLTVIYVVIYKEEKRCSVSILILNTYTYTCYYYKSKRGFEPS